MTKTETDFDLTEYAESISKRQRTILTAYFRLDRDTMIDLLKAKAILVNGKYYHVPERTILECLMNKRYGEIQLNLELMEA